MDGCSFQIIIEGTLSPTTEPPTPPTPTPTKCKYFKEDFSGTSANTWTSANGHWYVDNGKLNVDQITSGKQAIYETSFYPNDFFVIDTDIEMVSFDDNTATTIFPYCSNGVIKVNGMSLMGVSAVFWPSLGETYLYGYDTVAKKWQDLVKYKPTSPVTSIGLLYAIDKISLRVNKQDVSSVYGAFDNVPSDIDSLWLSGQGASSHLRFDNVCAEPQTIGTQPGVIGISAASDQELNLVVNSTNKHSDKPVYEWLPYILNYGGGNNPIYLYSDIGLFLLDDVVQNLDKYTFSFDADGLTSFPILSTPGVEMSTGDSLIYAYAYQNKSGAIIMDNVVIVNFK